MLAPSLTRIEGGRLILRFHAGQQRAWDSERRFVFVVAGSQSGKTSFSPHWLYREIQRCGPGDYLAVTPTFPLLKLKMLPEFLKLFDQQLHLGEWRAGDRVFQFHKDDTRVIFGSATHPNSLESATAKAAWLDECVAPETLIQTENGPMPITQIVNDRLKVRVWSYDNDLGEWELRRITRWIRLPQRRPLLWLGKLRITPNHPIYTSDGTYKPAGEIICPALYNSGSNGGQNTRVCYVREVSKAISRPRPKAVLQPGLCAEVVAEGSGSSRESRGVEATFLGRSGSPPSDIRASEAALCGSFEAAVGTDWWREVSSSGDTPAGAFREDQEDSPLAVGGQWSIIQLATRKIGTGIGLDERIHRHNGRELASALLWDRCRGTNLEDCHRGRESRQSAQIGMVRAEWVDASSLYESNGGNLVGGVSGDGCVYNLEVEGNHNYIADNILVSNCGQDEFRLQSWEAVLRRLALNRGRVLGTSTPYNLGWLKQQVYDRWRAGDSDYDVIQFESIANPAFPREEFERARASLPAWKFAMFYRGQFDRPAGLIYGDFIDQYREVGGHKVAPFVIPPEWPRHVGVDFGAVNTATIWLAHDPETNIYYLYHETLEGGKTTGQHAGQALVTAKGTNVRTWYGGAKSEDQQRMDWKAAGVPLQEPRIADVEAGIDRVIALLKAYRLYVFDTCKGVLDEFGTYARELDPSGQPIEKIKDKETFHRLDALRYNTAGIDSVPGVLSWLRRENERSLEEVPS